MAEPLAASRRLFGHGQVRGAGGDDGDAAARARRLLVRRPGGEQPAALVVAGTGEGGEQRFGTLGREAGHQQPGRAPRAPDGRSPRGPPPPCRRRRPPPAGRCAARGGDRAWRSRGRRRGARRAARRRLRGRGGRRRRRRGRGGARGWFWRVSEVVGFRRLRRARSCGARRRVSVPGSARQVARRQRSRAIAARHLVGAARSRADRTPLAGSRGRRSRGWSPGHSVARRATSSAPTSTRAAPSSWRTRTTRKPCAGQDLLGGLDAAQLAEGDHLPVGDARGEAGVGRAVPGGQLESARDRPGRRLVHAVRQQRRRTPRSLDRAQPRPVRPGVRGVGAVADDGIALLHREADIESIRIPWQT
jgi:hypothetical protein